MPRLHTLTVRSVHPETQDAVSVRFDVPAELERVFRFEPGQYLTLEATIDGEAVRRPYSICSGLDDDSLAVGIKAVPGGRFSNFAQDLKAEDKLLVMPPQGNFRWLRPAADDPPRHHLAFAAGSGITPILSIIQSVLGRCPKDTVTLFYGNRGPGSVMFLDTLHDLKDQALERLRIVHVFSREETDVDLHRGRLDGPRVRAFAEVGYFSPADADVAYICGPAGMNESIRTTLVELGMPRDRIRNELFTAAAPSPRRPAATESSPPTPATAGGANGPAPGGPVHVEAIIDGVRRPLRLYPEEDVISASRRQGVDLPYSCTGGMCCTCRCKVVAGQVKMAVCYSLEPWELEAGFVLACQAHPTTEGVILDFDAH